MWTGLYQTSAIFNFKKTEIWCASATSFKRKAVFYLLNKMCVCVHAHTCVLFSCRTNTTTMF